MRKEKIRKFTAFLLVSAVWLSALALPAGVFAQTDTQAQNTQTDNKKKKDKKMRKDPNKIRNEKREIKTNTREIQIIIREHYEKLYASNQEPGRNRSIPRNI